jgi:hypothetical protein
LIMRRNLTIRAAHRGALAQDFEDMLLVFCPALEQGAL